MILDNHIIYVVDDDIEVRSATRELLSACGFAVMTFGSAAEYLRATKPDVPACLLLDLQLPGVSGLDLQRELAVAAHPPIIFITGHGDIASSVRAMKAGAFDFLQKPFLRDDLLAAVEAALDQDQNARVEAAARGQLDTRYAALTPRERDVLPLVASGLLNKQAAARLGISIVTLQIHRGRIMKKMSARSIAELVRMASDLGISAEDSRLAGRAAS